MKKSLFLVLAFVLCLSLCACKETASCQHNYKITEIKVATCEENGSRTLQCSLCEDSFTEEMPATGHDYVAADCATPKSCVFCGEAEGEPLGHAWEAATCTKTKICATCGETEGEPLGHAWETATCTKTKICATCGETEGEPLGHAWETATCTKTKICATCGETEGEPLGHGWIAATCMEPKTCATCGLTEGETMEHDWVGATCTTSKTCSACGETIGEALGHEYESQISKEASCTGNGLLQYVCKRCAHSYSEEYEATTYTASQIFEMYKNTVGEITTYDEYENEISVGTCIVYSSDGKLVTNYHVLVGARSAKVQIEDKYYTVKSVLAFDKFIDLAIVKIEATGLQPAVWCTQTHATGKTVFAIGSSYGLSLTLSQGIISHADREMNGVGYIQHNAAISEGNSGGPLINEYGEVIGINTMSLVDAQSLNFAINIKELDKLFQSPMTFLEFYQYTIENDVFVKMKDLIISRGTYDEDNQCYTLSRGYSIYVSGYNAYRIDRIALYSVEENMIALQAVLNGGESCISIMVLPDVSGVYEWSYLDIDGNVMFGAIEARTFGTENTLHYIYNNISKSSTRTVVRKNSFVMAKNIMENFDQAWQEAGVKAKDLNFINY